MACSSRESISRAHCFSAVVRRSAQPQGECMVQVASACPASRAPPLPVPGHLCHIAPFRGVESALCGLSGGHSTVAMVVRHHARWKRKPDGSDAPRLERSLAKGDLSRRKCQKTVDLDLQDVHSDSAQIRGIARRIGNAERWPSGRRHQIANLASWVTGTEGSNPSLSAKSRTLSFLLPRPASEMSL